MSNELQKIYDQAPFGAYFHIPDRLCDELQRTLIPQRKVECRRWPDGRVMYKKVK